MHKLWIDQQIVNKPRRTARSGGVRAAMTGTGTLCRLVALLVVVTGILSACGGSDEGAPLVEHLQGLKGRLAFTSRDGLSVINADGSLLTNLAPQGSWPSWSPDGLRLTFTNGNVDTADIYVMNVDGSNITRLTTTGGLAPYWSPDGKRIVFTPAITNNDDIYVMNADGTNRRQLTTEGGYWPVWSPDGTQIAFRCHNLAICVINADGSNLRQLTPNSGGSPAWSPDGKRIAFASLDNGIYVINADGTKLTQLAHPGSDEDYPVWSPDGTRIAFVGKAWEPLDESGPTGYGLYVMRADGSAVTRLTRRAVVEVTGKPAWSPDGSAIAFTAWREKREGRKAIYIVRADGSALARVVEDGEDPVWQPRP